MKRQDKREKEAVRENLWLQVICESHYHATIGSRELINKQPLTTHLSVNKSQSEYTICKVPPIRSQGQILTLRSINCHGQPEVFSPSPSLLFLPLHSSSQKPLAPRVRYNMFILILTANPMIYRGHYKFPYISLYLDHPYTPHSSL